MYRRYKILTCVAGVIAGILCGVLLLTPVATAMKTQFELADIANEHLSGLAYTVTQDGLKVIVNIDTSSSDIKDASPQINKLMLALPYKASNILLRIEIAKDGNPVYASNLLSLQNRCHQYKNNPHLP